MAMPFGWIITHLFIFVNMNSLRSVLGSENPQTISVVVDSDLNVQDHVRILEPPSILTNGQVIIVEYKCTKDRIVGLEITTFVDKFTNKKIFQKSWTCNKNSDTTKLKSVKIKMKDKFAYRPDFLNKFVRTANNTKLQAWILEPIWWKSAKRHHNAYFRSKVKVSYDAEILPPYSRPPKEYVSSCLPWSSRLLIDLSTTYIPQCERELESVMAVQYPMALNGLTYGVVRTFTTFKNEQLEIKRQKSIYLPMYTVSVWLYVLEYCKSWNGLCSIMHHVTWDGKYLSPVIFINQKGNIHVQVLLKNGQTNAALTAFSIPTHTWVRLVVTFQQNTWLLVLNYGEDFKQIVTTSYQIPGTVHLDDTVGLFVFGGFEFTYSYKGYMGQSTIYRNRAIDHTQIPYPSPYHAMFELGLNSREERCNGFMEWTEQRIKAFVALRDTLKYKDTCGRYFSKYITQKVPREDNSRCSPYDGFRPRHYYYANKLIRHSVLSDQLFIHHKAAEKLYRRAEELVEGGFANIKKAVRILKQSACYGSYDAMYMLAVILNNGITVKANEIQAQAYLMMGSLDKHRLSSLALAQKHTYGLDTVPHDKEHAFMYYKYVADTTRQDKEIHKETDVYTESIRLTDELKLKEQTDEDGDVFHWLQHQAQKGVFSAQQHIARALFWGSNGLRRNMQAAIDYFRMGSESDNPEALYDYGILVLKGQGTKKNVSEGLSHIKRSAEKKNPSALNALGWYTMNYEGNMTQAVLYFEQAYKYGSPDAAYNLGWMHQMGKYPNKPVDVELALSYYSHGAVRNQIDAGVQVAHINSKGTSKKPRNVNIALEWARFIAEKNPALGYLLRKAVKLYRDANIQASLVFYIMAADAGIEVGSFNTAWLCEDNKDGVITSIEKECQWRNYNLSTQREAQFVDPYSLIKMGDYHWYGCERTRDIKRAADLYAQAALKNDPHALFNLGFMLEEGADIKESDIWTKLKIPKKFQKNNYTLLKELYKRCQDSKKSEAYIPCSIALYRVQLFEIWSKYRHILKAIGFVVTATITAVSIYSIVCHLRSISIVQRENI